MRRRYLALKVDCSQKVEEKELKNAVWSAVLRLFGEYGASKTNLVLINFDEARNYAVIRCAITSLDMIKASLASIMDINAKPVAIHVLGVSGTLKSLRRKFPPR